MPVSVGRGLVFAFVLANGLLGEFVSAQVPTPTPPPAVPIPTIPTPTLPSVSPITPPAPNATAPPAASPTPLLETPPTVLVNPNGSPAATSAAGLAVSASPYKPVPGSFEDQMAQTYDAQRGFRHCVWNGTAITFLPCNLLWQPPFAIKREPRFLLQPTSLDNPANNKTLDTSIGNTIGLFRFEPIGHDLAFEIDVFAVSHQRTLSKNLEVQDFRYGVPFTLRWGPWQGKLALEHTSSVLGTENIRRQAIAANAIPKFEREEVVLGVGRWAWEIVHLYGQTAYAYSMNYPVPADDQFRVRFDLGFECYCPQSTTLRGTPFLAVNVDCRGDADFKPGFTAQGGWLWRNPYQRLANIRLFAEYYDGRSPYGQFYRTQEKFYSVGLSSDF